MFIITNDDDMTTIMECGKMGTHNGEWKHDVKGG